MLQNSGFSWDVTVNTFTMIEKKLSSRALKCFRMKFLWDPIMNTLTMVEEKFDFWSTEIPQNIWDLNVNTFTMVEENFEIQSS